MRVWYFIAYAYRCFLNMHGHEPSVARSHFDFVMHLYLHPFLWWRRAVGFWRNCLHAQLRLRTGVLMTVQYLLNIL